MPPLRSRGQGPAWPRRVTGERQPGLGHVPLSPPQEEGPRGQEASPEGPPSPALRRLSWKQMLLVSVRASERGHVGPGARVPSPATTRGHFTGAEGSAHRTLQTTTSVAWPRVLRPQGGGTPGPLTMVWVYSWSLGSSYGRLAFFSRSDRNPWNAKGPFRAPSWLSPSCH